ncbi:unnamed protein product [Amoebophrya sp. A25]|nr:unnamed protein product [Amoebophrya sp. A25]|eukprot:GSA25T00028004001.1
MVKKFSVRVGACQCWSGVMSVRSANPSEFLCVIRKSFSVLMSVLAGIGWRREPYPFALGQCWNGVRVRSVKSSSVKVSVLAGIGWKREP